MGIWSLTSNIEVAGSLCRRLHYRLRPDFGVDFWLLGSFNWLLQLLRHHEIDAQFCA